MKKFNSSSAQCVGKKFSCLNLPTIEIKAGDERRTFGQALTCSQQDCINEGRIILESEYPRARILELANPKWLRKDQEGRSRDIEEMIEADNRGSLAGNDALLELQRRFKETE